MIKEYYEKRIQSLKNDLSYYLKDPKGWPENHQIKLENQIDDYKEELTAIISCGGCDQDYINFKLKFLTTDELKQLVWGLAMEIAFAEGYDGADKQIQRGAEHIFYELP